MERIKIVRYFLTDRVTIGGGIANDSFLFNTVELPWKNNERRVSCIPAGTYKVIKHKSPKFGECLWIQDVPGRSEILIHVANKSSELLGCIGVGSAINDIDDDETPDVINSKSTLKQLVALMPDEFELEIVQV